MRFAELGLLALPFVVFIAWRLMAPSGGPPAWLYGAGGAAVIAAGGAAYIARRRGIRGGAEPGEAGSGPAAGHDPPARGDAADDW